MPFRPLARLAGCLLALPAVAFAANAPAPATPAAKAPAVTPGANDPLVQQGAYLARAGDCIACHTAPGGPPFAGGLAMKLPKGIGTIYTPNITPDPKDGIGGWSFEQFDQAVRHGYSKRLGYLYPAMPYPSYARITDADMRALYAYFQHGVKPVAQANKPEDIPWPLNMRWPLAIWDWLFARQTPFTPDPTQSVEWNRGAYLVEGLGHCGACHTPRGPFLQEKALGPSGPDGNLYLGGARIDNWYAANLRGDKQDGLGRFSVKQIADVLHTGRDGRFTVVGSMTDVVHDSTQHLTAADVQAIAVFLKSLPPLRTAQPMAGTPANPDSAQALAGKTLYATHCLACHQANGEGLPDVFPALAENPTVNTPDALNTIRMMLAGGHTVKTYANPTPLAMPDLGKVLNDQQVADIATYVRSHWGNSAPAVSAREVAEVRKAIGMTSAMR